MENYLEETSKVAGCCSLDLRPLKVHARSLGLQGGAIVR